MSEPRLVIAVDGPAASGKGTLARRLAAHFGLPHLDTGLLYEIEMWKYATQVKERDFRPDIGHRHRANAHAMLMNQDVRTDEHGFRSPPIPADAPAGTADRSLGPKATTAAMSTPESSSPTRLPSDSSPTKTSWSRAANVIVATSSDVCDVVTGS